MSNFTRNLASDMFFSVKNKYKTLLCCFFLVAGNFIFSQDSLKKYSYNELSQLAFDNENNEKKKVVYLKEYYKRASKEKTTERLAEYYRDFIFLQPENKRGVLIDSALYYANITKDYEVIGRTYLTKGVHNHNIKNFEGALASYLKGYNYISRTDNDYLKNRIKYHIGIIKNYLSKYEAAIEFYTECSLFFTSNPDKYSHQRGFIATSRGLAWAYTKTGQFRLSETTLQNVYDFCKKNRSISS